MNSEMLDQPFQGPCVSIALRHAKLTQARETHGLGNHPCASGALCGEVFPAPGDAEGDKGDDFRAAMMVSLS